MENNSLALSGSSPPSLDSQRDFLQALLDSGKIPQKSLEEAYTVMMYGREMGLQPMSALNGIINIKGRLSLKANLQKALLLRGGVTWKTIYDGHYLYQDGSFEEFRLDKGTILPLDRISLIEFTRTINGIKMVELGKFTYQEGNQAGLVKPDSAWITYPRQMITARAFTNGAEKIAADLLMGFMSLDVAVDLASIPESQLRRNDQGEVEEVIDTEHIVVQ